MGESLGSQPLGLGTGFSSIAVRFADTMSIPPSQRRSVAISIASERSTTLFSVIIGIPLVSGLWGEKTNTQFIADYIRENGCDNAGGQY